MQNNHDTLSTVDNENIDAILNVISPKALIDKLPLDKTVADFITSSRIATKNIINLNDPRLLVITGPCSIHNTQEALEFAKYLESIKNEFPHLFIVMRTYFEKPRTTVGWKGLMNDPHLDDSCDINTGLERARKLLLEINRMGIPTAVEFLDTITPQYIADLVTWGAIGARTTESQEHRKLASGLSMPIGFKNGTNGDIQIAIDAIGSAQGKHTFLSVTKDGTAAIVKTKGNSDGHIILRGGSHGTNYDRVSIQNTSNKLEKAKINTGIVVDFSHANSQKDHNNQPKVCRDVALQLAEGNKKIAGVMIESNLKAGAQKYTPGKDDTSKIQAGISITDACVNLETNTIMLKQLNEAVNERNKK